MPLAPIEVHRHFRGGEVLEVSVEYILAVAQGLIATHIIYLYLQSVEQVPRRHGGHHELRIVPSGFDVRLVGGDDHLLEARKYHARPQAAQLGYQPATKITMEVAQAWSQKGV